MYDLKFISRMYPEPELDNIGNGFTIVVSLISTGQEGLNKMDPDLAKMEEFSLSR